VLPALRVAEKSSTLARWDRRQPRAATIVASKLIPAGASQVPIDLELRHRKEQAVIAAMQNPAGVTNRELRDVHGFPTIALKFQCEKLDIAYRILTDIRGERRFFPN
jgi:hypothetical protein